MFKYEKIFNKFAKNLLRNTTEYTWLYLE